MITLKPHDWPDPAGKEEYQTLLEDSYEELPWEELPAQDYLP
jgi:hypothetical protein